MDLAAGISTAEREALNCAFRDRCVLVIRDQRLMPQQMLTAVRNFADIFAHATQEKYQYRHKWQVGDLVLWDNRCLLHKANGDYDHSEVRYLYRVMLTGEPAI